MVQDAIYFEQQGALENVGGKDVWWGDFTACNVFYLVGVRVGVGGQPLEIMRVVGDSVVFFARLPIKDAMTGRAKDLIATVDLPDGHEALGALAGGGHDLTSGENIVGVTPVGPGSRLMGMTPVAELSMTGLTNKEIVDIPTAIVHGARLDVRRLDVFLQGWGVLVMK
jgi:hypothetical protein